MIKHRLAQLFSVLAFVALLPAEALPPRPACHLS